MSQSIQATPTKLRSGDWGAKVQGSVAEGDVITITTKAGKSWSAKVSKVVWSGDGVAICATQSMDRPSAPRATRRRGTWTGCSCGSVEEYTKDSDCWTCKHDA